MRQTKFYCKKCKSPHFTSSKKGIAHRKHKKILTGKQIQELGMQIDIYRGEQEVHRAWKNWCKKHEVEIISKYHSFRENLRNLDDELYELKSKQQFNTLLLKTLKKSKVGQKREWFLRDLPSKVYITDGRNKIKYVSKAQAIKAFKQGYFYVKPEHVAKRKKEITTRIQLEKKEDNKLKTGKYDGKTIEINPRNSRYTIIIWRKNDSNYVRSFSKTKLISLHSDFKKYFKKFKNPKKTQRWKLGNFK